MGGARLGGVLLLALIVLGARLLGGRRVLPDLTDTRGASATTTPYTATSESANRGSSGLPDPAAAADVHALLDGLNAVRAAAGIDELHMDDRLAAAALAHSRDLATSGRCSHDGMDGSEVEARMQRAGYVASAYGEIIACGSDDAAEVLLDWRSSAAHRKILLDTQFQDAGVGIVTDGADGPTWVVTFGAGG